MAARHSSPRRRYFRGSFRGVLALCGLLRPVAGCREAPLAPRTGSVSGRPVLAPLRARVYGDVADFVDQQLALRGSQLPSAMIRSSPAVRGTLAHGAAASHEFDIAAGHCYRVVAVGGIEVNDLDLTLFGPDGSELDSDRNGETYPVLGSIRPLCPPTSGRYRVEVRMASGQGDYGLQVFSTP